MLIFVVECYVEVDPTSRLKMLVANNFTRLIPLPHTWVLVRCSDELAHIILDSTSSGIVHKNGVRTLRSWIRHLSNSPFPVEHRDILTTHVRKLVYLVNRFGANATSLALAKRPLSSWWAIYQIRAYVKYQEFLMHNLTRAVIRGTLVYKSDPTMHLALKQSLDFLAVVDFLTAMWPSPGITLIGSENPRSFTLSQNKLNTISKSARNCWILVQKLESTYLHQYQSEVYVQMSMHRWFHRLSSWTNLRPRTF
jgi:hypothetical protein